jgi:hypothetical protein
MLKQGLFQQRISEGSAWRSALKKNRIGYPSDGNPKAMDRMIRRYAGH